VRYRAVVLYNYGAATPSIPLQYMHTNWKLTPRQSVQYTVPLRVVAAARSRRGLEVVPYASARTLLLIAGGEEVDQGTEVEGLEIDQEEEAGAEFAAESEAEACLGRKLPHYQVVGS
jgi:hypothetical protein